MLKADFGSCQIGSMVKRIGDKLIFSYPGLEKAMAKYKPYDYSQRVMIPLSLKRRGGDNLLF